MKRTLPTDSEARKAYPMMRGGLLYFPAAIAGMSRISLKANSKHNPGEEMHHARGKSSDHGDCILRHLHDAEELKAAFNRGELKPEEFRELLREEIDQLSWRAAAYSQQAHEDHLDAPLAPNARLPETETVRFRAKMTDEPILAYYGYGSSTETDADGGAVKCTCGPTSGVHAPICPMS